MRYSISLAAAALAAAAFAVPATAQAQAYRANTASSVHLRAGPARDYPVVAILPAGYPITVAGCVPGYTWCDVIMDNGVRGWVWSGNITYEYQGRPVVLYDYAPAIGIGLLSFVLNDYWHDNYYNRPFYRERDRWVHHAPPAYVPHTGPRPDYRGGSRPDYRGGSRPDIRSQQAPAARPGGDPFQGRTPWMSSPDQTPAGDVTQPRRAAPPPAQARPQAQPQPQPRAQVQPVPQPQAQHVQPQARPQPQGGPSPRGEERGERRGEGRGNGRGDDKDHRGDGR